MAALQFIHESNATKAANVLAAHLRRELRANKQVAWFVSGGSNIVLTVAIMAAIPVEYTASLTVLLLDERFGVPGHPNSNWQQLQDAGLNPQQARVTPVLQAEQTFETTVEAYEQAVRRVIDDSDIIIAQCGIGGDGHIAGILPHSAAIAAQEWVCGYDGGTYKRITITPSAWQHIDVAYAFAYGETKHGTLVHLKNNTLSVNDQPAQLLKITPEAYVYTDQQV